MSISDTRKKRGRGRPRVNATPLQVRVPPKLLDALDQWIADCETPPASRPDAIRAILTAHLRKGGYLPKK